MWRRGFRWACWARLEVGAFLILSGVLQFIERVLSLHRTVDGISHHVKENLFNSGVPFQRREPRTTGGPLGVRSLVVRQPGPHSEPPGGEPATRPEPAGWGRTRCSFRLTSQLPSLSQVCAGPPPPSPFSLFPRSDTSPLWSASWLLLHMYIQQGNFSCCSCFSLDNLGY